MPEDAREALRRRCLESLASIMIQVNKTRHSKAGSPIYGEAGSLEGVGSFRIPNPAEYDACLAADFSAVATTVRNKYYCEMAASDNEQAYLISMLDRHPNMDDDFGFNQGANKLLRMFIDWGSTKHTENDFVLAHPDLDLQNILIDEDGNVTGLVDWDGVTMVPRSMGCSFPKWLSRDWDRNLYQWYSDKSSSDPAQLDHSPDQMNYYREMYAQCFEAALKSRDTEQSVTCGVITVRQSVLFDTLRRAASRPRSFYWSVAKICDLIGALTSQASFKSATGCVVKEGPERQSIDDDNIYTDSGESDKDSRLLLNESTNDSDSTTSSNSKGSNDNSKSSGATSLTSESASVEDAQLIKLCTCRPKSVFSGMSPGQISKLSAIEEASHEDIVTIVSLAQTDEGTTPNIVATASEESSDRTISSKSPNKLRGLYESLQLIVRRQKKKNKPAYQGSDSSGGISATVGNTVFELMSKEKIFPVTHNIHHAAESKVLLSDSAVVQSANAEVDVSLPANDSHQLREPSQFQHTSDQSKVADINLPVADQTSQEDIRGTSQSRNAHSETLKNEASTSSEANNSPDSTDPLIGRKGKVSFARRMAHMLASTCETSDTDSDQSIVSCKEIQGDFIRFSGTSKTRRVKRWLKDTFHKGRTSDTSSPISAASTSYTPTLAKPPHISQMSSISALGDPFQKPENANIASPKVRETKKGPPGQYRILPSGAKAWDLQNLEPIDSETLSEEEFLTGQIFMALGNDTFDEARMQRLKTGFFALLDSL